MGMHFSEAAEGLGIPFAVAMAANADGIFHSETHGPVAADTIFAIASMTKAITAAAALQLVERGLVHLDEAIPNLGELPVLEGFNAADEPVFSPTRHTVTLRQLLTHTAGFAYPWNHPLALRMGTGAPPFLVHVPGARWHYGVNIDWVGRAIETVSGEDLETYFQQHILGPLGMADTSFLLPPEKLPRLAANYQRDENGLLAELPRRQPPVPSSFSGGGVTATGQRLLSESSIAAMSVNQTGELSAGRIETTMPARSCNVDFHPGADDQFTLAFLRNPQPHPGGRSAGSLSWGGIRNTFYWIDPARGIAALLLMQFQPFCDPAAIGLLTHFEHTLYKDL